MAPIFVGSNSDDTRIRSNRVGLAASTADPGSASEGDIYYNSTNNQVKTYDGSSWSAIKGSGTVEVVASGSLSNGQTVIVTSDGKVTGISSTPQVGTPAVFESANILYTSAVYDSTNGKVVIAYRDSGNQNHGTAVVGTVSGSSISFGTPVEFNSDSTTYISATFDSTNGKVVIAYRDDNNNDKPTAIVGTVSGTSISFGTAVVALNTQAGFCAATFDSSNNKVVIAFRDIGNSNYGTAVVGTVSGTSISFGPETVFESANVSDINLTFDSTNQKVVIAYQDAGNSDYGTAIVGTVSGTSISFGSATVFESANSTYISSTFDSTNGKVVIAYKDVANSDYGTAIVGTVSGTSISFGTAVVFNTAESADICEPIAFDSTNGKVVIVYRDVGNSNYATAIAGTVSGTSISFDTAVVLESARYEQMSATFDSTNGKVVIAYKHDSDSQGEALVFSNKLTDLTSENFIGFSDAAYSDGDTANIQIISSIDDAQSGLTTGSKFYVQNDGTLSTTAGDPSVLAGTAVSGTEILIKQ